MNISITKQPSALFPLAMSFAALAMVLGHAAMFGVVHEADEGIAAHIFQLLMAAQVPIVAFFAIKWLLLDSKASAAGAGATRWRRARSNCRRLVSHLASRSAAKSPAAHRRDAVKGLPLPLFTLLPGILFDHLEDDQGEQCEKQQTN